LLLSNKILIIPNTASSLLSSATAIKTITTGTERKQQQEQQYVIYLQLQVIKDPVSSMI
jgi:hypothetical protein